MTHVPLQPLPDDDGGEFRRNLLDLTGDGADDAVTEISFPLLIDHLVRMATERVNADCPPITDGFAPLAWVATRETFQAVFFGWAYRLDYSATLRAAHSPVTHVRFRDVHLKPLEMVFERELCDRLNNVARDHLNDQWSRD